MTEPSGARRPGQCRRPSGLLGKLVIWSMNRRHAAVTAWGLGHIRVAPSDVVLDVGCGGGRLVSSLAAMASDGRVHGIDYSAESVAAAHRENRALIDRGRVEITQASVSDLPFADDSFDVVTAVETHFWWPDLPRDLREVLRVTKPGGELALIAEFYNGGKHARYADRLAKFSGIASLTLDQHRDLLAAAGFVDLRVVEDESKGWICALGRKPARAV